MLEETKVMKKNVNKQIAKSYALSLNDQKVQRMQMKEKEKYDDKIFAQLEDQKLQREDNQREQNFMRLKQYQVQNDKKYQLLNTYQQANNF